MFIPAVVILPYFLKLTGLILAQPVADALSFALALPITIDEIRLLDRDE